MNRTIQLERESRSLAGRALWWAFIALSTRELIGEFFFTKAGYMMYYIDIPPHFFGGIACGYFALAVFIWNFPRAIADNLRLRFIFGIPVTLSIGALWEIYEVFDGYAAMEREIGFFYYKFSTVKDLAVDIAGAVFILYCYGRRRRNQASGATG